jgi:chromosome segregation ATPase
MDYFLNRINVILIALVGSLCVYQWSGEKKADDQIVELRRVARVSEDHIASQAEALRQTNEDRDELKKVVTELKHASDNADVQIRQQKARLFTLESDGKRGAAEADELKRNLSAYKDAVAARDRNIQILLGQRQQLIDGNRDAVAKATEAFNGLATKYADLVSHYNELAVRYKALTSPPPAKKQTLLDERSHAPAPSLCLLAKARDRAPGSSDLLYR